jgi:hypothetical protein
MHNRYLAPVLLAALGLFLFTLPASGDDSILKHLKTISTVTSTVPANGDVNPYGIVRVQRSIGRLYKDHILISNFNNLATTANPGGEQGTGTTVVDVAPNGKLTLFAQINPAKLPGACPGGVGLTTALAVLRTGWVIVGSLPTSDGTSATAKAGCLIVLDAWGHAVETFSGGLINGPWDMTWLESGDDAALFVTNVLNGTVKANGNIVDTATVIRINLEAPESRKPWIQSITVIGWGFPARTDPAALVIGPTGVGLSPDPDHDHDGLDCRRDNDELTLYVADSLNNRVAAIHNAVCRKTSDGTGDTVSVGGSLNDPLGLTVAPNGHILTANGDDGFVTEITPFGKQLDKALLDSSGTPPGSGALFGLIYVPGSGIYYVDDATNTLNLFH